MILRRYNTWLPLCVILAGVLTIIGCSGTSQSEHQDSKIHIITTFYPLYEFAKQVGGDHVDVINLVPAGVEPHEYEPSPRDVATLQKSDLLIYNGAGLEGWIDKVLPQVKTEHLKVLKATEGMSLLTTTGEPAPTDASNVDPHVWLDPILAEEQVKKMEAMLSQMDPGHANDYKNNSQAYTKKLEDLDAAYKKDLSSIQMKDFITTHSAFLYMAKRYGLQQISITGVTPEQEPSPAKMAEIVRFAKEHQVRYIFFETLVSPKVSQIIAEEIGADTLILNPLEGLTPEEQAKGLDYVSIMRENLTQLNKALKGS